MGNPKSVATEFSPLPLHDVGYRQLGPTLFVAQNDAAQLACRYCRDAEPGVGAPTTSTRGGSPVRPTRSHADRTLLAAIGEKRTGAHISSALSGGRLLDIGRSSSERSVRIERLSGSQRDRPRGGYPRLLSCQPLSNLFRFFQRRREVATKLFFGVVRFIGQYRVQRQQPLSITPHVNDVMPCAPPRVMLRLGMLRPLKRDDHTGLYPRSAKANR